MSRFISVCFFYEGIERRVSANGELNVIRLQPLVLELMSDVAC